MEVIGSQRGLTRREKAHLLEKRLGVFLRNPSRAYRLNTRERSDTGLAYSDAAIDAGQVLCAFARCTQRQQRILELWLCGVPDPAAGRAGRKGCRPPRRHRATQAAVALAAGVSIATVKRELAAAMDVMTAMVWEDERPTQPRR